MYKEFNCVVLKTTRNTRYLALVCFFITAMLSACTTMRAYQGDPLPRSEVARVKGTNKYLVLYFKIVRINSVDGVKTKRGVYTVELLPGQHTLGVTYTSAFLTTTYTGKGVCYITLNAMSGANYIIKGESSDYGSSWHAWLENTVNGEKIDCSFNQPKAQPL